ncbi:VOC family protein [Solibacillus sp. FSL K6-1523]|uniref:VOC family protein n=1 Tax=Solibacillus sp. FSL K6-1523 TaxID=2921471 RepID=UPI0030F93715
MDIINAKLKTEKLKEMKEFYEQILGFSIENETSNSFRITLGKSSIEFNDQEVIGMPYYHFACDIPSNQFEEAKNWIKNKTNLLTEDGTDEIYFAFSVAKSFYFEDPSGNIIEFIARLEDNPPSNHPFSIDSIQKLSEMSLIVPDKMAVANQMINNHIVERGDSEIMSTSLSFMSDKKTKVYLLLAGPNRRWLFSNKVSKVFPIEITLDSGTVLGVNDKGEFYINN